MEILTAGIYTSLWQIYDVIPIKMAKLNLLVSLLATTLYTVANWQSWFCTPNLPSNNSQKPGDAVHDQFVKSSVISLQTHVQQLVSDTTKLQSQMQDLSNENSELHQKRLSAKVRTKVVVGYRYYLDALWITFLQNTYLTSTYQEHHLYSLKLVCACLFICLFFSRRFNDFWMILYNNHIGRHVNKIIRNRVH